MAKTKGALFSKSAKGKIGPVVVEQRREGQYFRTRDPKRGPPSEKQKTKRKLYGQAVEAWRNLTPEEKKDWNISARHEKISGFNLFLKYFTTFPQIAIYGIGIHGLNKYGKKGE